MPEASNSLQKRKRGGQPGNSNRRVHGRYTKKEAARREELRGFRRKGRALVILVDNILKARKALKLRLAARALAAGRAPVCSGIGRAVSPCRKPRRSSSRQNPVRCPLARGSPADRRGVRNYRQWREKRKGDLLVGDRPVGANWSGGNVHVQLR
jgi:hypothetical protein